MQTEGNSVLTEQTKRFIDENPVDIVMTHNAAVADGAGGSTWTPTPVGPQRVRMVSQFRSGQERRTFSGEVVRPEYTLIAMPDADVQKDDTFTYNGLNCEVVWINDLGYELMAEVAIR